MKKKIILFFMKRSYLSVGLLMILASISIPTSALKFNAEKNNKQILFTTSISQRQTQLKELTKELTEYKKKIEKDVETIKEETGKATKNLTLATQNRESASQDKDDTKIEYWNKKITFLTEQKQNLLNSQTILKNIQELKEKQIDTIKEIIRFDSGKKTKQLKKAYSWLEWKTAQEDVSEIAEKIRNTNHKLNIFKKNKTAELDTISSLKKQIEIKKAEQDKALNKLREEAQKDIETEVDLTEQIGLTEALFSDEINALQKKLKRTQTRTEELEQEIKLKGDEIALLEAQHTQDKNDLATIENRIIITKKDVEDARSQTNEEEQKALVTKGELNKKITELQFNKTKLDGKIDKTNKVLKKLESEKREDGVQYHQALSELKLDENQFLAFQREIEKLETQIALVDTYVKEKNLWHNRIDIHRKLLSTKEDYSELLSKFTSKKEEEESILKKFKDKKQQTTETSLEIDKKIAALEKSKDAIQEKKGTIFSKNEKAFFSVQNNLETAKKFLEQQRKFFSQETLDTSNLIEQQEKIIKQYNLILSTIIAQKIEQNIWERSPKAISFKGLKKSFLEAESFFKKLFWDIPTYLGPTSLLKSLKQASFNDLLALFFFLLFYLLVFFCFKKLVLLLLKKIKHHINQDLKRVGFLPLSIAQAFFQFVYEHLILITLWNFIFLHIIFDFKYVFYSLQFFAKPFFIAMFYLLTIPIMVHLSRHLLLQLKELNKKLSFLFFAEKLQDRFILLITSFCFSTAVLIPFKKAFLTYFPTEPTVFPNVIRAAYSLILVIILLLFFSKEDVLRIIPSRFAILIWFKEKIEKHYYPVFFFLMGLLILSNPYIGYSNLSWYLAFAIPTSSLLIYALFIAHYSIRKYAVFLFVKEEDEEIVDKFEHAKTYYGIFVIFSFIALSVGTFMLVSRIWGYEYSLFDLWKALSETWTIPFGKEYKLGFVQLVSLISFITAGFFISSATHKFILNKLFEILQTEPGTQNTFSRIIHYFIVSTSTILGFVFIHLEGLFWYIGTALSVAFGLSIRDIIADYVAGFFVLIERPIEIGNFISIDTGKEGEIMGTVHKINARTTTLISKLKHSIIIPNKDLAIKTVNNWGKGRFAVGFEVLLRVDYNSDVDLVKQTTLEVIQSNPTILRVPKTIVRLEDFEDSSLFFLARTFISSRRVLDQWDIAGDLRTELFKIFKQKGIVFAFPQRVLHMGPSMKSSGQQVVEKQSPISFKFDENK